jgi:hypothetical protein
MQSIMAEKNDDKNFVKISINKFYRVTGKAIKLQESSQMLRFGHL